MIQSVKADIVAKGILLWIGLIILSVSFFIHNSNASFFRFGPNENLRIFNISIDSPLKYTVVVSYTILSTIIRTLQEEILVPWIIQNIQNEHEKSAYTRKHAYEIVLIDGTYRWFDWFMYMNILLSQIDMTLIETCGNLITSYFMTKYYLSIPKHLTIAPTEI
jgi:hypothetical protein